MTSYNASRTASSASVSGTRSRTRSAGAGSLVSATTAGPATVASPFGRSTSVTSLVGLLIQSATPWALRRIRTMSSAGTALPPDSTSASAARPSDRRSHTHRRHPRSRRTASSRQLPCRRTTEPARSRSGDLRQVSRRQPTQIRPPAEGARSIPHTDVTARTRSLEHGLEATRANQVVPHGFFDVGTNVGSRSARPFPIRRANRSVVVPVDTVTQVFNTAS